jgi:hypothetical protein
MKFFRYRLGGNEYVGTLGFVTNFLVDWVVAQIKYKLMWTISGGKWWQFFFLLRWKNCLGPNLACLDIKD